MRERESERESERVRERRGREPGRSNRLIIPVVSADRSPHYLPV